MQEPGQQVQQLDCHPVKGISAIPNMNSHLIATRQASQMGGNTWHDMFDNSACTWHCNRRQLRANAFTCINKQNLLMLKACFMEQADGILACWGQVGKGSATSINNWQNFCFGTFKRCASFRLLTLHFPQSQKQICCLRTLQFPSGEESVRIRRMQQCNQSLPTVRLYHKSCGF